MKYFIVFLFLIIIVLYIVDLKLSGKLAKKNRECSALETMNGCLRQDKADQQVVIDAQKGLIKDPHFRKVVFCSECKEGHFSEYLNTWLCGAEEKKENDYCSEGNRKD